MKNTNSTRSIFLCAFYGVVLFIMVANAHSASIQSAKADLNASRIALMPFIVGKLESPDAPSSKPLSKPLNQIAGDDGGLPEGSERILNRLVSQALKRRFPESMLAFDRVTTAYSEITADPLLDTIRKQAVRLGEMLQADFIMVGTLWRFREKGTLEEGMEGMPASPASVGFALYLVDVKSGARLWRGFFDGTQKALTEDVLGGAKQIRMGLRWLSAEELAQYGVKSLMQKLSKELSMASMPRRRMTWARMILLFCPIEAVNAQSTTYGV